MARDVQSLEAWMRSYEIHLDGGGTQTAQEFVSNEGAAVPDVIEALEMIASLRSRARGGVLKTFGKYRVERELGFGAQGTVYLAEDTRLGRRVALKILVPGVVDIARFFLRFRREAETASRVSHPNLCAVYEADVRDGHPYIAMQYVEGTPLSDLIADEGRRTALSHADKLSLVENVTRGVEAAHRAGLTHRDIKPSNIIISPSGAPVLVDFGLARLTDEGASNLTRTGDLSGTPAYMAPEQIRGGDIDQRTDIHALGVVLYELLSGVRPYEGATRRALFDAVLRNEPERPVRTPADLWVVLKTSLAKDPDQRFASADDLAEDLRRVRMHEPIKARPVGPLKRARRWIRRHPAPSLVMLLTVASVAGFTVQQRSATRRLLTEKSKVEIARGQAERRAYLANIHAADGSLANHDVSEALRRLQDCPPEFRGWEWRYLSNALDQSDRAIKAQEGTVFQLALSRDGSVMVSGGRDRTVQVWDPGSLTLVRNLEGVKRGAAISVAVSPDGSHVAAGAQDRRVTLWKTSGELLGRITVHPGHVISVGFSPDGKTLLSSCLGKTLAIHDVETLELLHLLEDMPGTVRDICVTADGATAYFGTASGYLGMLDLQTFRMTKLTKVRGQVWSMALAADGASLLVGLSDQTARHVRIADGAELGALRQHKRRVTSVDFLPDERALTASLDGSIRIWDLASERCEQTFIGHIGAAMAVRWSPGTKEIVSAGSDGFLRTWQLAPSPSGFRSMEGAGWPSSISFHPDGRTLAVAERYGKIFIQDAWTGELDRVLQGEADNDQVLKYSANGRYLFSAGDTGQLLIWHGRTYQREHVLDVGSALRAVAVHPDSGQVAAGGTEGVIRLWDPSSGAPTGVLGNTRTAIRYLAYSPDGRHIAATRSDGMTVYDLASGRRLAHIAGSFGQLAYDPSGKEIAVATADQTVLLTSLPSCQTRAELIGHHGGITGVAYSPDGARIASCSIDQTVRIWDRQNCDSVAVLRKNTSWIRAVAWSHDGKALASGASDRTLQLWRSERPAAFYETIRATRAARDDADPTVNAGNARRGRPSWNILCADMLAQSQRAGVESWLQRTSDEEKSYGELCRRALAELRCGRAIKSLDVIRACLLRQARRGAKRTPLAGLIHVLALLTFGDEIAAAHEFRAISPVVDTVAPGKEGERLRKLHAEARQSLQSADK